MLHRTCNCHLEQDVVHITLLKFTASVSILVDFSKKIETQRRHFRRFTCSRCCGMFLGASRRRRKGGLNDTFFLNKAATRRQLMGMTSVTTTSAVCAHRQGGQRGGRRAIRGGVAQPAEQHDGNHRASWHSIY